MDQQQSATAADGKQCPACGKDIGLWPVVRAPFPDRIRCPHCRARLTYRGIGGLVVVLVLVAVALTLGWFVAANQLPAANFWARLAIVVVGLGVLWVPVELWAAVYLRRAKVLSRAE